MKFRYLLDVGHIEDHLVQANRERCGGYLVLGAIGLARVLPFLWPVAFCLRWTAVVIFAGSFVISLCLGKRAIALSERDRRGA